LKFYFRLQYKRLLRHIKDEGLNPYLGIGIGLLLFTSFYYILFQNTPYARYIYLLTFYFGVNLLGGSKRNQFLQQLYNKKEYRILRLIENGLMAIPFSVFLILNLEFTFLIILLTIGTISSFINNQNYFQIVIPTPFSKKPFEFIVGFRSQIPIILACYALAIVSIYVKNFNIGAFALILLFFVALSFYSKPEQKFFVWTHNLNTQKFLISKTKIAFLHSFILTLPMVILLYCFTPNQVHVLAVIGGLGFLSVLISLLGKYAFFPSEVNITTAIILGISILLPPLLLITIPMFYIKAKNNLNPLLH